MNLLLTNDDGYQAEGLRVLCEVLSAQHNVYITAPSEQQSGASHSFHNYFQRIEVQSVAFPGATAAWAIRGTPVDTVKIGLEKLCVTSDIDCVISGINKGSNLGIDVYYSGTVGAAVEAALFGVSALAVSLDCQSDTPDYRAAAVLIRNLLPKIAPEIKKQKVLLNINVPDIPQIGGLRTARLAVMRYHNEFAEQAQEDGKLEFLLGGSCEELSSEPDDDVRLLRQGYATCTPLTLERTNHSMLEVCRQMLGDD